MNNIIIDVKKIDVYDETIVDNDPFGFDVVVDAVVVVVVVSFVPSGACIDN